ncbi:unnamed protein product, partial [Sphagnum jensenii]
QAVIVDKTMYISGQLGVEAETLQFVGEDAVSQAHQALKNMGNILQAAGVGYGNVVKATVLLADINDFGAVNDVYKQYFTDKQPARAAYQAANLPK